MIKRRRKEKGEGEERGCTAGIGDNRKQRVEKAERARSGEQKWKGVTEGIPSNIKDILSKEISFL
jgi:hypothetical protein